MITVRPATPSDAAAWLELRYALTAAHGLLVVPGGALCRNHLPIEDPPAEFELHRQQSSQCAETEDGLQLPGDQHGVSVHER